MGQNEKKTEKAKQIVHEAEITRQHARYKIPAKIEIDGKIYDVYDWSVSGVGIIGLPDEIYKRKYAVAKMIFRFDDFETVLDNLHLEFVSKRPDGVVGARFTELTPQQIAILNQIISAYLAGDIITEDDIIHAVTRAQFMQKKEEKPKVDKKKSILILLLIWVFILFLLFFLIYVMYTRIYIVRSENAYFDANMTVIRAPSPSYIEFAKKFKPGMEINKSEILYYAHLIYGGVQVVKSPLKGELYTILIHNGDFRNVGEPIFSILENKNFYIVANILHKDLVKINIGDIATVQVPNGDKFYARVTKIEYPYNIVEKHARPLQNIYNQARNYDKVILYPINYKIKKSMLGSSVVVHIDTFRNRHHLFFENLEENNTKKENEINNTKPIIIETNTTKSEENLTKEQNISIKKITPKTETEKNITTTKKEVNATPKKVILVKKYCIIAASSTKPFNDEKAKKFIQTFKNAKEYKYGKIYELKVEYFNTYREALEFLNKNIKKFYKDAFIIKCKVKEE
ncbi:hypothetical protein [Caminibacter sp.]